MSIIKPPVETRASGQSADDVDSLLRDFFQAALPRPWPAFLRPARATLPLSRASGWRQRFRSSLALAASLILLAVSLWLLSGKVQQNMAPPSPRISGPGDTIGGRNVPGDPLHRGTPQPDKH